MRLSALLLLSLALSACTSRMPAPDPRQAPPVTSAARPADDRLPLSVFSDLLQEGPQGRTALARIASDWDDIYAPMLPDLIDFSTAPKSTRR